MANLTSHQAASHSRRPRRATRESTAWLDCLPIEWRDMAIAPLDLVEYHEYEVAASRCFGYDVDGETCYYAHGYALKEIRSDDDEEYYQVLAYGETVHAWRLRDDRWLVHRIVHHCGEGAAGRGFYSFAEHCPR